AGPSHGRVTAQAADAPRPGPGGPRALSRVRGGRRPAAHPAPGHRRPRWPSGEPTRSACRHSAPSAPVRSRGGLCPLPATRWHDSGMEEATIGLVLDCADPEALAGFWAPALGLTRLGAAGNYVLLVSSSGALP